jgi:hypothetical protein
MKPHTLKTVKQMGLLFFLVLVGSSAGPKGAAETDYSRCLTCHKGIERISPNHSTRCSACHLLPGDRSGKKLTDHKGIVPNPSDPRHVKTFCLPCHKKEIRSLENSLHSTMAGIINQTRYLWGAQKQAAPARYGLSGPFQPLPKPHSLTYPDTPQRLVDDFLRRRCLRCHIHTRGSQGRGLYRASGCAACHVLYHNDGRYRGKDRAVDPSEKGRPITHTFTTRIPNTQCLHCHHQNRVGADYEGLFEQDHSRTYRAPLAKGKPRPMTYGLDHHHLAKDLHGQKGLWCVDCHTRSQVMGDGHAYSFQMQVPKIPCTGCHGGFNGKEPLLTLEAVGKDARGLYLISKNQGRRHRLPRFSRKSRGHNIRAHARVRCSACHAQWSFQDYGLSVIREDRIDDDKWVRLSAQGDPYLGNLLRRYGESREIQYPASMDWVADRIRPGIWSVGWRFRRWAFMPLGIDPAGNYAILRPRHQYLITYGDRLGNVPLDSAVPSRGDGSGRGWAFMPYVPHTTAPFGRTCDRCHGNRVAAGRGIHDRPTRDTRLFVPSPPAVPFMRLLNPEEQKRLLNPSMRWRRERLRALHPFSGKGKGTRGSSQAGHSAGPDHKP